MMELNLLTILIIALPFLLIYLLMKKYLHNSNNGAWQILERVEFIFSNIPGINLISHKEKNAAKFVSSS